MRLLLVVAIFSACAADEVRPSAPSATSPIVDEAPPKKKRTIAFERSVWTLVEATDLGHSYLDQTDTMGRFIRLRMRVTNRASEPLRMLSRLTITDSKEREYGGIDFVEPFPPNTTKEIADVIEIPIDATNLAVKVFDLGTDQPQRGKIPFEL